MDTGIEYDTVESAINAADEGDVIQLISASVVEMPKITKGNLTIEGMTNTNGEPTTKVSKIETNGNTITLKNLVLEDAVQSSVFGGDNITIENCYITGTASPLIKPEAKNLTIKDSLLMTTKNVTRWGRVNGVHTYENCEISGGVYGIHYDSGSGKVVINGGSIDGFNAFAASISLLTIDGTRFENKQSGYAGANFWGKTKIANVTLVDNGATTWLDGKSDLEIVNSKAIDVNGKETSIEEYVVDRVKFDDNHYGSLQDAITSVTEGGKITLNSNIALSKTLIVDKDVTLDLNGKTLSVDNSWDKSVSKAVLKVVEGANLSINDSSNGLGAIDATTSDGNGTIAVWANEGKVTIKDGKFFNTDSVDPNVTNTTGAELIYAGGENINSAKVVINDGWFSSNDRNFTLNLYDGSALAGTASIEVYGGTFIGFDPSKSNTEPTNANINSFIPSGYEVNKNANGNFYVTEKEAPKSTVEFIVDGKVWRTYRVTKGADIRMPEVPEKEGYVGEWDHDGENIRTATTITAVYTKVEEPVNNTDLSDYADFQLPVYTNSRVTNISTANGSITVDGYMFKANANLDNENSIWREIIFVNEEDYSMAKAYRKQVTPVYNTWLNKNMTATGNGAYKLDYANYTVTFSNTDINNYVGNTAATRMATGSYLAYMRISDGTDSYLFPLKDIVLSDGSTLTLPSGFEVVDTTTRALRYIVK
ncbi:MAG: hypothetical protein E7191_00105 [Erysipelotrichaceae bacterium]|nr:hypothetical protein [Erysipelotrichaceae bacterium]